MPSRPRQQQLNGACRPNGMAANPPPDRLERGFHRGRDAAYAEARRMFKRARDELIELVAKQTAAISARRENAPHER